MAIDAIISRVSRDTETGNLILELEPRREKDGSLSIAGQPKVEIVKPTHTPKKGQAIWGGDSSAIIEPSQGITEKKHYVRTWAGVLAEDW